MLIFLLFSQFFLSISAFSWPFRFWEYPTTTPSPFYDGTTSNPYYYRSTAYPWYPQTTTPNTGGTVDPNNPCRNGFTISWFLGKACVRFFTTHSTFQEAYHTCQQLNSNLVSIHSAVDNRALANMVSGEPFWLGLNCSSNRKCDWLDGSGDTSGYDNFVSGNPNVDVGSNVYMETSGSSAGRWISANGDYTALKFFCEYLPVTPPPSNSCPNKYEGYCYTPHFNPLNVTDAQSVCQSDCGSNLVSIHNYFESWHVLSMFNTTASPSYFHLGLYTDGEKRWIDGTSYDYDNFDYFNTDVGYCASMANRNDVVSIGDWISSQCDSKLAFVCKRPANATCGSVPTPTLAPSICYQTQFLSGNGTIYSPNYPYTYLVSNNTCTYVITVPQGFKAQIKFPVIELDPQSSISLYSSIEATDPFAVATPSYSLPTVYQSTTNVIKMIFRECQGQCGIPGNTYYWLAQYGFSFY